MSQPNSLYSTVFSFDFDNICDSDNKFKNCGENCYELVITVFPQMLVFRTTSPSRSGCFLACACGCVCGRWGEIDIIHSHPWLSPERYIRVNFILTGFYSSPLACVLYGWCELWRSVLSVYVCVLWGCCKWYLSRLVQSVYGSRVLCVFPANLLLPVPSFCVVSRYVVLEFE